jgi:hypothetical protein
LWPDASRRLLDASLANSSLPAMSLQCPASSSNAVGGQLFMLTVYRDFHIRQYLEIIIL